MQRNAKKLLAKLSLTISLLLLSAVGVSAADYVIYYNGSYVCLNANGTGLTITTTFNPNTCLWTCYNGTTETTISTSSYKRALKNKFTNKYLYVNSGSLSLSSSSLYVSYWYLNNSYLCYSSSNTRYWINTDGSLYSRNNDNFYGPAFSPEEVTITFNNEVNNASVQIDYNPTELTSVGTSSYIYGGFQGDYTPSYYTYAFKSTNHNYWSGTDYLWNTPTLWNGNGTVIEWSVDPFCSGFQYVSLSPQSENNEHNYVLTYLSDAGSTAVAKVILKVTHPDYPDLLMNSYVDISLLPNRIDPVSITANDIALEYGNTSTISYTISPSNAFKYVTFESVNPSIASVNSSGVVTGNSVGSTTITLRAYKSDRTTVAASTTINVTVLYNRIPYSGRISIPGTIEAENFDRGGEGFTYHDSDSENEGDAQYRTDSEGVDIAVGNNGTVIGYTATGEWLEYSIDVIEPGIYSYEATVSSGLSGSGFSLSVIKDGNTTNLGTVNVTNTGNWDSYIVQKGNFSAELEEGPQILRITITGSYCNIDKVTVKPADPTSITSNNIELENGSNSTISYTLSPLNAFNYVTFESANPSIASVNSSGVVTGNSVGSTTITLRAYKSDMVTVAASTTINVTVFVQPTSITSNNIQLENGNNSTISYTLLPSNAFNYVTFESANPSIASVNSSGVVTGNSVGSTTITLRAYKSDRTTIAASTTINVTVLNNPGTSPDKPYIITSQSDLDYIRTHLGYHFVVSADIDLSGFSSISGTFTGSIDGGYHVIRGLTSALFTSTNNATIKNVVLDNVNITSGTNVGPLVNEAAGTTRIYNCGVRATNGSSVIGSGYVGGLIGRINNNTRVINCYSFANVSGGTWAAGIVGYNPTATTTSNITTAGLIMNCMYYGRILSGTNRAPIYGGAIISNAGSTGINNYNYYSLSSNNNPTTYNCALAAEERYLTRFEFYRGILNSNRKLCAYYVKGNVSYTNEIGKWVLDPSIAKYPIIKAWGKYPSIINRSTENAVSKNAYEGKGLGTLSVTINRGSYGSGSSSTTISLPITDMDTLSYDYNYYKIQLPYYNDYFSGNYSGNRVVTGWRVTAISGGTTGTFTTSGDDAYNFANRYCTAKDLYSTTNKVVFAQGGFFNVPEGVTAITIQANWASAVYLSDPNYDKVYTTGYVGSNYTVAGSVPTSYNSQTVYTTLANAISNVPTGTTVYDAAIVLVGNYHTLSESWENGTKPFTVMSVDENGDNEPDYCMIHGHSSDRVVVNPIRFDFLWHPGLGMTSKVTGTTQMPNQSIFKPKGHFEITETALGRYTEFEYDYSGKANNSPLILMGGIFEQFVSIFNDGSLASHTSYLKVGGNAFVNAFTPGCHPEQTTGTNHQPISVLGGEYPEFYLSGLRPNAATTATNANCYVNGGRFHMFAGACYEQINGNVTIKVDHALVDEFYGGGINSASPITGNINVTIDNSRVRFYCGGPKFGDMGIGKTVNTNATGSTFSEYYGAGFGGTSISSVVTDNSSSPATYPTNYFTSFSNNRGSYDATNGIMTGYKMEYFDWAGATTTSHVARFYVNRASLSLAMTRNVTSTLNNCTILNNFYGGGCLGTVNGTVTSTLNNCTIMGNVFGGGYSVDIPVCDVYPTTSPTFPTYDGNTGTFSSAILPTPIKHTWSNLGSTSNPFTTNENGNWIFTNVDFSNLGKVSGNTIVTVTGASRIDGALFGGGDESMVTGNTSVTVSTAQTYKISTVYGGGNIANVGGSTVVNVNNGLIDNVFGGGNNADIGGNTSVRVLDGEILGNVYGGGNQGDVIGSPSVQIGTTPAP